MPKDLFEFDDAPAGPQEDGNVNDVNNDDLLEILNEEGSIGFNDFVGSEVFKNGLN